MAPKLDPPKLVGARVAELRSARGLKQRHLARALGVHSTAVSRIENGDRDLRMSEVAKLARKLGVQPSEIAAALDRPVAAARAGCRGSRGPR
jgi:transcriptional regulator with XRE-family HTH domain